MKCRVALSDGESHQIVIKKCGADWYGLGHGLGHRIHEADRLVSLTTVEDAHARGEKPKYERRNCPDQCDQSESWTPHEPVDHRADSIEDLLSEAQLVNERRQHGECDECSDEPAQVKRAARAQTRAP